MERFWDARAREDALWFVDSRLDYGDPDEDAFWAGGEEALDRLLEALGASIEPTDVVVDLGCGVGRLTRPLARLAARVTAIDVSGEMLADARRLNPALENVEWVKGDGESLAPIADASVDACISHVVFRHIPDPAITLGYVREMGRVLRPGGFAAFEFSNDPTAHVVPEREGHARLAAALGRGPRGLTDAAWLGSYVDLDDLHRAAAEAGLEVERVVGAGTALCAALLRRTPRRGPGSNPVARYYDEYWGGPHGRHYEPHAELWAAILDAVEAGARCLDVGCGAGTSYAPRIVAKGARYVGVDVSPNAVAAARAAGLDTRVIADAGELPFEDESFDVVTCIEVLEHLLRPDHAVAEALRVLRPGGRLVVSTPNVAYWRLRANLLFGLWNPAGDELARERPWRDPHIRFFTPRTLERMLRQTGFARIERGAHGGRFLDHATSRPTDFGQSRAYRVAERLLPSLLGATIHAVAVKPDRT